ncbi:hypothetical protein CALCODRAFT_512590 [Calocera cornea HHB12733]|uniref:DNA mismatch repair proteins mutS family domain-containing protein n=1 Tax=Calocera cornea HHB12733 TaxID=1353952 RepID=A0A165CXM4_9BASI|nr:hypothetical protein CALCODRAFT_512590 [Calocera cornea HHB12733]
MGYTQARAKVKHKPKTAEELKEFWRFLEVMRDGEGRTPDQDLYNPSTLFIPEDIKERFTSFQKQVFDIKATNNDVVRMALDFEIRRLMWHQLLLVHKGLFWEMYENDAKQRMGHAVLGVQLISRERNTFCMDSCGIHESTFTENVGKLLGAGYKVGLVEELPNRNKSSKVLASRRLTRILSRGTLDAPEWLEDDRESYCPQGNLSDAVVRFLKSALSPRCVWTTLPPEAHRFEHAEMLRTLVKKFPCDNPTIPAYVLGVDISSLPNQLQHVAHRSLVMESLSILKSYVQRLYVGSCNIERYRVELLDDGSRESKAVRLDPQSIAHLEILLNSSQTSEGSLRELIDHCCTAAGSFSCSYALSAIQQISLDRLNAIEELWMEDSFKDCYRKTMKPLGDLERRVGAARCKRISIKDFRHLLSDLLRVEDLIDRLLKICRGWESATSVIQQCLLSVPPSRPFLLNLLRDYLEHENGIAIPDGDETRWEDDFGHWYNEVKQIELALDARLKRLRRDSGCLSLSYYHQPAGDDIYLVEAPDSEIAFTPPDNWERCADETHYNRFAVPSLKKDIRALLHARTQLDSSTRAFWEALMETFSNLADNFVLVVNVLSELDCLISMSAVSSSLGTPVCRPQFIDSEDASMMFTNLSHIQFRLRGENFVANDISLGDGGEPRIILLTGANMSGKSTLLRTVGVTVLLAQIGMYLPATAARLCPIDGIFTRIGAYDAIARKQSTFNVEMSETARILQGVTTKSLALIDELGRGTSTFVGAVLCGKLDGLAIAEASLHFLSTYRFPLLIFSTHHSAMAYQPQAGIRPMYMRVDVDYLSSSFLQLKFIHQLTDGVAEDSLGIACAQLAGLPSTILERASKISQEYRNQMRHYLDRKQPHVPWVSVDLQHDLSALFDMAEGRAEGLTSFQRTIGAIIRRYDTAATVAASVRYMGV